MPLDLPRPHIALAHPRRGVPRAEAFALLVAGAAALVLGASLAMRDAAEERARADEAARRLVEDMSRGSPASCLEEACALPAKAAPPP